MVCVYEGRNGTMNFYFNNKFVATLPLNEVNTSESYIQHADTIIIDGLKSGYNLSNLKKKFWKAIHITKDEKDLSLDDSQFFAFAMLALIKLKQIDADAASEGFLVMSPYKGRRRSHPKKKNSLKSPVVRK